MKMIGLLALVLMASVSAHASQLRCVGQSVKSPDPQWMEKVSLSATLVDSERVDGLTYVSQVASTPAPTTDRYATVRADAQYKPRNPSYQGFNRFPLKSTGWTYTYLLLPSNSTQLRQFQGYVQQVGHDFLPLIVLNCAQY